ncbi:MAG: hypothetical protein AAF517_28750, partial [Planctomycetota bacterium]
TSHQFGLTDAVSLNLPSVGDAIPFPSLSNRWIDLWQTARISASKGVWAVDGVRVGTDAVLSNGAFSANRELLRSESGGGGIAGLSLPNCELDFDPTDGSLGFCCEGRLFDLGFNWGIYSGPIFQGQVGVANVLVTTSIALAANVGVDAVARFDLDASNPFGSRGDLWLTPDVQAALPVDISGVLFTGVSDVIFDADIRADVNLEAPVHVGVDSSGPSFDYALQADLRATLDVTACVICPACPLVPFVCHSESAELYNGSIYTTSSDGELDVDDEIFDPRTCSEGGGGIAGGADDVEYPVNPPDRQIAMASSPNGSVQIAIGLDDERQLRHFYRVQGFEWRFPTIPAAPPGGDFANQHGKDSPAVLFVDDDTVLVAWSQSLAKFDPELTGEDPGEGLSIDVFNDIYGRSEIVLQSGRLMVNEEFGTVDIEWGTPLYYHGIAGEHDALDDDRADGRVALARRNVFGVRSAFVSWTRYDTHEMAVLSDLADPSSDPAYNLQATSIA